MPVHLLLQTWERGSEAAPKPCGVKVTKEAVGELPVLLVFLGLAYLSGVGRDGGCKLDSSRAETLSGLSVLWRRGQ